jgi:YHS domain-containing protein
VALPLQVISTREATMTTKGDEGVLDPICGKRVDGGSHVVEYKKQRYVFCSSACKEKFRHQIERDRLQELARLGALFASDKVRWGVA